MATAVHAVPLSHMSTSSSTSTSPSPSPSVVGSSPRRFALAQVHSDVCLVQGTVLSPRRSLPPSPQHSDAFSLPPACVFHSSISVCSSLAHEGCHSALSAVEAQIYAHEFITIFRYSHPAVLHPSDIRILEWLDEQSVLDEEDKGTVFLARDVMERLRRLTDRRWSSMRARPTYSRGGKRML